MGEMGGMDGMDGMGGMALAGAPCVPHAEAEAGKMKGWAR